MGQLGDTVRDAGDSLVSGNQRFFDMVGDATGFNKYNPEFYDMDSGAFAPNAQEQAFTQRLIDRSEGRGGPSPAELQLRQGLDQVNQNAAGMAASQRGVSPALAARLAQQYSGQAGAQTNQQAGILRAQEQVAADQSLAQALQSQRQARMGRESLGVSNSLGQANIGAQNFENNADRATNTFKSIGSGIASGMNQGGMVQGYSLGGSVAPQLAAMDQNFLSGFAQAVGQIAAQYGSMPLRNEQKGSESSGGDLVSKLSGALQSGGGAEAGAGASAPAVPVAASNGLEVVPGKPMAKGDHPMNDTVPAMLSPGEIVVPRTVAQMSPAKIAEFVKAIQKKGTQNGK